MPVSENDLTAVDPRVALAKWANENDEWMRTIVEGVISSGRVLKDVSIASAYAIFRQEKAFEERTLPFVELLSTETSEDEKDAPLAIVRLSDVRRVNALVPGVVIEPNEGLTILYGESGTGKTGYSRIFKALANSRTADEILGDIQSTGDESPSATVEYTIGDDARTLAWTGTQGVVPFTRMSIFDSPAVIFHVDDDLEYVYVPAALALFNHVIAGIQGVQARIDTAVSELKSGSSTLLARFPKESSVYPLIETLGAATDLEVLWAKADRDSKVNERLEVLRQAVAALQSDAIGSQIALRQRDERVLQQAATATTALLNFAIVDYNEAIRKLGGLQLDYETFRTALFAAAVLPAEPEGTWSAFISAGEDYRQHLVAVNAHNADQCLYCRQDVGDPARQLLSKYSAYLEDKISADIQGVEHAIGEYARQIAVISVSDVASFTSECAERDDKPDFYDALVSVIRAHRDLSTAVGSRTAAKVETRALLTSHSGIVNLALERASKNLTALSQQAANRTAALATKKSELAELTAAAELTNFWSTIEGQVKNAKEADRLKILKAALPKLSRAVTELSKRASDHMINQSFDALFAEECEALRAPTLKVQFVGREGKAQRRKVLSGRHRPSKVLSEGEQKVIAIADFLAEARLAGITAPVIFDDPVSSLDHRRVNEVAQRIANLAAETQVIVFTHDILFTTKLLSLFEKSKRCNYFQVTDEEGKGKVTRATGPRWDTLKNIRSSINKTIEAAKSSEGEARAALVRTGYDWIRSWCEVFTETELLRGVTQRYQPNVGMSRLANINTEKLPVLIETVNGIFEEACRFIDGHSQPLPTLSVSPTIAGLEAHWAKLQECVKVNNGN